MYRNMIRLPNIAAIILLTIVSHTESSASDASMHEFRGLRFPQASVELERDSLDVLFAKFAQAGFNAVFPKVWYTGGTIYPSAVVEAAGGPGQLPAFHKRDPLPDIIELAHKYGLEVHAWVEYGFMMHHSYGTSQHGALLTANPGWKNMSKDSLYYESTVYGNFFWADPANPEVVDFIVDLHRELVERYPDIDGIHLDRIRYPNDEFGYSEISRQRFQDETGRPDPFTIQRGTADWTAWVNWRRAQTTETAGKIYEAVKSVNENVIVSGAVVAPYMIDSDQEKLQYWPDWVAYNYVDMISPLMYLSSISSFVSQLSWVQNTLGDTDIPIYPRIAYPSYFGVTDTTEAQELLNGQVDHARENGIEGMIVWNHLTLSEADAFYYIENNLYATGAVSPFGDRITTPVNDNWFQASGSWEETGGGLRGIFLTTDGNDIAEWFFKFPTARTFDVFASWPASEDNTGAAVYTGSVGTGAVFTKTVDQRNDAPWHYLGTVSLDVFEELTVDLSRESGSGNLVADAVRVRKRSDAGIERVDVIAANKLELHLSIQLDPGFDIQPESITISPYGTVTAAGVSPAGGSLLIDVDNLVEFEVYGITIEGLTDIYGRSFAMLTGSFSVYPNGETEWMHIVNDADGDAFRLEGNLQHWSNKIKVIEGYIGDGYRQTFNEGGSIGLQQAFWTMEIPADGNYKLSANWTSDGNRASGVPYVIYRNDAVIDTVRVDQRYYGSRWNKLGIYTFEAGDSVTVEINNRVVPQPPQARYVIADAIQLQHMYITSVDDRDDRKPATAEKYVLAQNYPNPFNPATTIEFTVPDAGEISLVIYDILGRKIATIADGWHSAGTHRAHFDATGLSSGMYVYTLRAETTIQSRKMIVVR